MEGGSSPPSQVPSHLGEGFSKVSLPISTACTRCRQPPIRPPSPDLAGSIGQESCSAETIGRHVWVSLEILGSGLALRLQQPTPNTEPGSRRHSRNAERRRDRVEGLTFRHWSQNK